MSRLGSLLLIVLLHCVTVARANEHQLPLPAEPGVSVDSIGPTSGDDGNSLTVSRSARVVASSLAIVLGGFALVSVLSRKPSRPATGMMQKLAQIQIAPQVQLQVMRFGNRILLLHVSNTSVQNVAEITDPDEVQQLLAGNEFASDTFTPPRVAELLQEVNMEARESYSSPRG